MSVTDPSSAVMLFGTETVDPKGRVLRAGSLTATLDSGALRTIRVGDVEVIRGIAFLVRDENWGTFAPQITNLMVTETDGTFSERYDGHCQDAARSIRYQATITCSSNGDLSFTVAAKPETDVLTNRTGIGPIAVILHLITVAFHAAGNCEPGTDVMGQRAHIEEGLRRADKSREPGLNLAAIDTLDRERMA